MLCVGHVLVGGVLGVFLSFKRFEVELGFKAGGEEMPCNGVPGRIHALVQWEADGVVGLYVVVEHTLGQSMAAHRFYYFPLQSHF